MFEAVLYLACVASGLVGVERTIEEPTRDEGATRDGQAAIGLEGKPPGLSAWSPLVFTDDALSGPLTQPTNEIASYAD